MSNFLTTVYTNSPTWFQNLGISAYGLMWRQRRYGGNFSRYVKQFAAREKFSYEEWQDYQTAQLRLLLLHSNRFVPYYTALFANLGLKDVDLEHFTLEDLSILPILEKEDIRHQPELFVSQEIPIHKLNKYYTSGTTGTPLSILRTTDTDRKNQAVYEARVRNWGNVNYRMSRAMVGGRIVVPKAHASPPFWRYNIVEQQLYLSAFHISPSNIDDYVSAITRFQPDYLVGYASSQYFLARMILNKGLKVHIPKTSLTSSEKLTSEMRETISKAFGCEVFDAYSGVEACCQISECEFHTLHESPDMGIIELLDQYGNPTIVGDYGEIIATGLLNFEQPLIRYRTGDLAIRGTSTCSCGRQMHVYQDLIGRLEDTVIGQDGREMVRFHGIFVGLKHVQEGQIIQKTLTDFLIRLVVSEDFGNAEKAEIHQRFVTRLGEINLDFEFIPQIERTNGGKFRAVISHVKRSENLNQ